jgi:glutathione S-transferase
MCAPSVSFTPISVFSPQLKVEDELDKSPTGWFAGGPNPTMADYMMSFGLEAAAVRTPNLLGPKTKAWVERVHERYALFFPSLITYWHVNRNSFLIDPPSRG